MCIHHIVLKLKHTNAFYVWCIFHNAIVCFLSRKTLLKVFWKDRHLKEFFNFWCNSYFRINAVKINALCVFWCIINIFFREFRHDDPNDLSLHIYLRWLLVPFFVHKIKKVVKLSYNKKWWYISFIRERNQAL